MVATFQVLDVGVVLPDSAAVYMLESVGGQANVDNLAVAAQPILAAQADDLPKALVWDDLIFKRSRFNWIPFQVQWPQLEGLLMSQISHRGRCAIRADILRDLYQSQTIASPTDTSAAFAYLSTHAPTAVSKVPNFFRFTRFGKGDEYQPHKQPQPTQTANSISVVVNYRDRPDLMQRCLEAIAQQTIAASLEVILVDNQSQPENRQRVEAIAAACFSSPVKVVHLTYDAPFNHSAQTNLAVEAATSEVLFMLNNDASFISSDVVQTLANWALMHNVASAGPRIVGEGNCLVSAGVEAFPPDGKRLGGVRESTVVPLSQTVRQTVGNTFACCAIARSAWNQIGGLDADTFPTQYNDADFHLKALALGLRHIYIGSCRAYHQPGQSEPRTRQQGERLLSYLRDKHPQWSDYIAIAPTLIKFRGPVLKQLLNPSKTARSLMFYRKLHKQFRNKVLTR